eukprot:557609-Pyramimonas_sp.AAC.1
MQKRCARASERQARHRGRHEKDGLGSPATEAVASLARRSKLEDTHIDRRQSQAAPLDQHRSISSFCGDRQYQRRH